MNDVYGLLLKLKALGGKVYVAEGKLKIDIEKGLLTEDLSVEIRKHRDELIGIISQSTGQNDFEEIPVLTDEQVNNGLKNGFPISDAQRRLWVLSQFEDGSVAYNIPGNIYLDANVEIAYFTKALEAVVDRHEMLRTVFRTDESGEVKQWVLSREEAQFTIEHVDLRGEKNKPELIQEHLIQNAWKLFDLENGPLFRSGLLQVEDTDFVYYYNMHHIISDGWSFSVFFRDLQVYYEAFSKGEMPIIEDLRIQYKDYSAWQLGALNNDVSNEHRDYWLNSLKGELPRIVLPSSKPRPRIMSFNGQTLKEQYIGSGTIDKVRKYSEEQNGSPFMVFFAAWNILIHRYTGLQDITTGTPLSGREHVDLKNQIGFYVNTLAIRLEVNPNESFTDFFSRVKVEMLESYSHQMYPFNRLVEELEIPRDASRSVLFDVMLVYNGSDGEETSTEVKKDELSGIADVEYTTSKFDIEIGFRDQGDHFAVWGVFNPDVYDLEMIEGLINHYKQLLRVILADPETPIFALDFMSQKEKRQLTIDFNSTKIEYPQVGIAQVFEEQVSSAPDAVAVIFSSEKPDDNRQLTYQELNKQVNQFARYLQKKYGVEQGDLIGFKLDRDHRIILAILGILKSGGAYVPIDPSTPSERIVLIEQDCKLCIDALTFDHFYAEREQYETANLDALSTGNDLAYVMYTSGSTGRPKGVMIEQRGVIRLVKNANYYTFSSSDNLLSVGSIGFDATTLEFFGPILNGATLIFCPKDTMLEPELLQGEIEKHGVNVMLFTSGWLNQLIDDNIELFDQLTTIMTGGDRLSAAHMWKLRDAYPNVAIINVYGPTENATFSLTHSIDEVGDDIPIGKPVSNSTVYILDQNQGLQPIGVTGEIYLGGDGLARGYLNDPDLTAEKFINHPLLQNERLYKSGDLGYWNTDGTVTFVGRQDDQVKVRGYRIELGEIEYALSNAYDINEAVVTVLEHSGEKEIVAYFTSKSKQNLQDLKIYLEEKLPVYMVPAYLIEIDEFTLNQNGKLDRTALPHPADLGVSSGHEYVAPENELQVAITTIWEDVLKREKIGINDDFFALGGHSLRMVKLNNEYQKQFGVKLTAKDLFKHSSLVSHAKLLQAANQEAYLEIPPLQIADLEKGKKQGFSISDGQRRLWILSQFDNGSAAYNIPGNVILDEEIDIEIFQKAVLATIERHEILRAIFKRNEDNEIRQWFLELDELNFTIDQLDFRLKDERDVDEFILHDSFKPFDLEKGPLLRASLLRLENNRYLFYFNLHHIISDGWSMEVISKDILAYYEVLKASNSEISRDFNSLLPPLKIQYKDFTAWFLKELEENPDYEVQKAYWKNKLSGDLPVLDLPSSRQRAVVKTHNGHTLATFINAADTKTLKTFVSQREGTIFTGLLAVWNVLMYRYTGQKDILTGSPVAGREHGDLENQIGFYVNTMVLRNEIVPNEEFTAFYSRLKDDAINSFANQTYPFDRLVEELHVNRDISRNAIFDCMLILQNNGDPRPMGELTTDEIDGIRNLGAAPSKFDITISFEEVGEYLSLNVVFNRDVYELEMIEGLIKHYKLLLRAILAAPETPIFALDFLAQEEKQQLTIDFNNTKVDYPQLSIAQVFEEQALVAPDDIAVIFSKEVSSELTYGELNELANQFARYLKNRHAVEQGDLVGFKLTPDHGVILAILGILKCGAAYVPIDPSTPTERSALIVHDCKCCIDAEAMNDFYGEREKYETTNLESLSSGNDLAYVMYTSGSTGKPKGVMIEQHSVIRLVKNNGFYSFSSSDNLLAAASIGFDAATLEFFGPILNGGTVVFCPKETLLEPELLQGEIEKHGVNIMWFTAGWLNQLVEVNLELFAHLTTVMTGGDRLSPQHIGKLRATYPDLTILNGYGPTENTTFSLTHTIDEVGDDIPIGRPISNATVYILDENAGIQPIGVTGEICLGGDGLARGYVNDLELTDEKFIPHPYRPNERLYRSGDLGYWRSDGTVAFVGRRDDQVKVRGYRIELGEIEHALNCYIGIKQAVVTVTDHTGERELVAYFTALSKQNLQDLKIYLEEKLPGFMVPAYLIELEEFTLNQNGKVDKNALPHPTDLGLSSVYEYAAPQNELEEAITTIWEEVLKREKIGINDDFFASGGHSLRAMSLMNRYQDAFNVKLSINDLFRVTTPSGHADLIKTANSVGVIQIPVLPPHEHYAISDAQRRIWVLSQFEEGAIAYNMPGHMMLSEQIDIELFKKAVYKTIDRHEILRTVFKTNEEGEIRQFIKTQVELDLQITELDFSDKINVRQAIDSFIAKSGRRLFDLENGPLLTLAIVQASPSEYVFVYNMHHIIGDGWSLEVLEKDIIAFYTSFQKNEPPKLDELAIQYKDYAAWQLQELSTESHQEHERFWLNSLEGALPVLNLPGSQRRPDIKTNKGKLLQSYLDEELTEGIKEFSSQEGGTVFITLLSIWTVLLYKYTGQNDLIIGTPIAGRDHANLSNQIGCYVNTLALRNYIKDDENFNTFYRRVKENTIESYGHQMYPFDRLVENLGIQKDTSRNPVFDVMLTIESNAITTPKSERIDGESAHVNVLNLGEATAKFDLDLTFQEINGMLSCYAIFNSDIYDTEQIEYLLLHFNVLAKQLILNPTQNLNRAIYLQSHEIAMQLNTFSATETRRASDRSFVQLFEEKVALTPEKIAIEFDGLNWSYKELSQHADRVASYLREKYSIKANDLIGIQLDRGPWTIAVMIGILKSGGAYVPIDQDYPTDRIQFMLKDSNAKMVFDSLELMRCSTYDFQSSGKELPTNAEDLAYVIYTSGTTGKPKGVMISQHSLVDYAITFMNKFSLTSSDRVIQQASIAFDTYVEEIFPTLLAGGTILMSKNGGSDIEELEALIDKKEATILSATPLILKALNDRNCDLASLRLLISGGDKFSTSFVSRFIGKLAIYDSYGPSESTVCATYAEITEHRAITSIGKPIANREIFILGDHHQLLPMGSSGEICIGGEGLALGYLNQPELTLEKFVEHPFNKGKRLYKSGDVGRWLSNGEIEFIGRKDNQVKVRGYRIELNEVEETFSTLDCIESVVVVARENWNHEQELIAFYLADKSIDQNDIRKQLRFKLPEYMLPTHIIELEVFPLSPNGKVDRTALSMEADQIVQIKKQDYSPARNDLEKTWVEIWQHALKKEKLGIDDDFFENGGNSILAVSVSRVKDLHIPLKLIYQERTIRKCLAAIDDRGNVQLIEQVVSVQKHALNILLVPYAGATDIAYHGLSQMLAEHFNVFVVSMPWHSLSDTVVYEDHNWVESQLMDEILSKISGETIILGHCAGTILALSLSLQLEKMNFPLIGLFQCAENYQYRYNFDLENGGWSYYSDDEIWNDVILKLGFEQEGLHEKTKQQIIKNLRHDARNAEHIASRMQQPNKRAILNAPIHAIYGEMDPLTRSFQYEYKKWGLVAKNVSFGSIENGGHYFVNQNVDATVNEIRKQVENWNKEKITAKRGG